MCIFFSPISSPTNPFYFLVSCFLGRDCKDNAMPFHGRAPAQDPSNAARGAGEDSPFPTTFDDMSQLRSGLLHRKRRNYAASEASSVPGHGYYHPYRMKPGRKIDPRMLPLLESFQELYFRRRDLFRRLFPNLHDEFSKLSEELAAEAWSHNQARPARGLRRSLSVGSPTVVSRDIGGEAPPRLERFKVHTVDLDDDLPPVPAPPSGGGGGTNKPGGSKSK